MNFSVWILCFLALTIGSVPIGSILDRISFLSTGTKKRKLWVNVFEALKGLLGTSIMHPALIGLLGGRVAPEDLQFWVWMAAFSVVLGHSISPFGKRDAGTKPLLTAFGALLLLNPVTAIVGFVIYFLVLASYGSSPVVPLLSLLVASVFHLALNPVAPYLWAGAAIVFVLLIKYESDMDQLLR